MFNSRIILDRLRAANGDPRRRERLDPHRGIVCDEVARAGPGEMALAGAWRVECPDLDAAAAAALAGDFTDFLRRLGVRVAPDAGPAAVFQIDSSLRPRDCWYACRPDRITIAGGGVAGLWAGLAWVEWEMRVRHGAILPLGRLERPALWDEQISQGPWGANYSVPDFSPDCLADDGFRLYAHHGVNTMMIYGDLLFYAQSQVLPELNCPDYARNLAMLRDAARRAGNYGVGFSYLVVAPKLRGDHPVFKSHPDVRGTSLHHKDVYCLCSSNRLALDFYAETLANLAREVPGMRGFIMIVGGESFYHCRMWVNVKHPCPVCYARAPEEMVAGMVGSIQTAVSAARPGAYVAVWQYNPTPCMQDQGLQLIPHLPAGAVVMHQIDKGAVMRKAGYRKSIWDYSIDFNGIAELTQKYANAARQAGHPFFVKTETGIGLETIQFPYVPAMQRLADKWRNVRTLAPAGVHQSWLFFGMCGTRAELLGFWAAYRPEQARDEFLAELARRDFGVAPVELVLQAWAAMSRAVGHLPGIPAYYTGPGFLGPAHPLVPQADAKIPDAFYANLYYLMEGDESLSANQLSPQSRVCLVMDRLDRRFYPGLVPDDPAADVWVIVENEYAAAVDESRRAWDCLQAAAARTPHPTARQNLLEETRLAELVHRTLRACRNTIAFLRRRAAWELAGDQDARQAMRRIAADEKQNALAAIPLYRAEPWLDLALRLDGLFSTCETMILEKVCWLDDWLAAT